jgi:hypothetical protein
MSRKNLKRQPRGGTILNFHGTEHRHGGFVTHIHSNRKRKGQVVKLAEFKAKRATPDTLQLPVPPGWSMSEWCNYAGIEWLAVPDDYLSAYDIHAGDIIVFAPTADVQDLDLAYKVLPCGSAHIGECYTSHGEFVIENGVSSQRFRKCDVDGRVVGVLRNGHYVPIAFPIRPLINDAELVVRPRDFDGFEFALEIAW